MNGPNPRLEQRLTEAIENGDISEEEAREIYRQECHECDEEDNERG